MAKGHRSQIKRARNESNRETRPSAKLSYARISVQKACYVLDVIRGKDVQTALGILTYNPRYASSVIKKLLESAIANAEREFSQEHRVELTESRREQAISPSCWMKDKEEKHGTES